MSKEADHFCDSLESLIIKHHNNINGDGSKLGTANRPIRLAIILKTARKPHEILSLLCYIFFFYLSTFSN